MLAVVSVVVGGSLWWGIDSGDDVGESVDIDEVGEGDQPDVEIAAVCAEVRDGVFGYVLSRVCCHVDRGGWVSTRVGLGRG